MEGKIKRPEGGCIWVDREGKARDVSSFPSNSMDKIAPFIGLRTSGKLTFCVEIKLKV